MPCLNIAHTNGSQEIQLLRLLIDFFHSLDLLRILQIEKLRVASSIVGIIMDIFRISVERRINFLSFELIEMN